MVGSLLDNMDDILDKITMNDDQHHDNSLSSWSECPFLVGQSQLLPVAGAAGTYLFCPGNDPTPNSASSVPCFQASLVTSPSHVVPACVDNHPTSNDAIQPVQGQL